MLFALLKVFTGLAAVKSGKQDLVSLKKFAAKSGCTDSMMHLIVLNSKASGVPIPVREPCDRTAVLQRN